MPRPCCKRWVAGSPGANMFKPAGIPASVLQYVTLSLDELEALRLADWEGLYQEEAAEKMKVSRPTFARIVETARKKVAEALVLGKAIRFDRGSVIMKGEETMPNRDGRGPLEHKEGRGRGPCGCGRRRGWSDARQGEAFDRRGGMRHGCAARGSSETEGPGRQADRVRTGESS